MITFVWASDGSDELRAKTFNKMLLFSDVVPDACYYLVIYLFIKRNQ